MTLADIIKFKRHRLGFTLRDLEAATGVSNPLISQIETGKVKNPSFNVVRKLAKALRISPLAIFSTKE